MFREIAAPGLFHTPRGCFWYQRQRQFTCRILQSVLGPKVRPDALLVEVLTAELLTAESDLVAVVELPAVVLQTAVEEQVESGHLHYPAESGAARKFPLLGGLERMLTQQKPEFGVLAMPLCHHHRHEPWFWRSFC